MADDYTQTLREPIEAIERALVQPEAWATLMPSDPKSAGVVLDAAAVKARDLRRKIVQANAARDDAEREANLARARRAEYEQQLCELEENLVRPLCAEFGAGNTHQLDTGFARVALWRKPASVIFSERSEDLTEADVIAVLPREFVRLHDPEPDKKKIKEALESGVVVPGFELRSTGTTIRWGA